MELANIEKLLEKYFEATATLAEEQELKEYFNGNEVAPHLLEYQPLFQYFSFAKTEQSTRPVPLKRKYTNLYRWISVAAVAVLVFGIYFGNNLNNQGNALVVDTPEQAYQETKKALTLIAENLNRGTEKMAYLNEFETTKNKLLKNN